MLEEFSDVPLVAISDSQRRRSPNANRIPTIPHGLDLIRAPLGTAAGDYLAFVGRIAPEKGVSDAIAVAKATGLPLRMAAKVYDASERDMFEKVVAPAIAEGVVEFIGEVGQAQRDELFAHALATLMLGPWPEPFGLVAIESMATGTPVVARRAGALPEIIEHDRSGYLVDDLQEAVLAVERAGSLDRRQVRACVVERFSVERMLHKYEQVYARMAGMSIPAPDGPEPIPVMADRRSSRDRSDRPGLVRAGSGLEAG